MSADPKPFRFGVVSGAPTATAWRELVVRIESLGYSTVFLSDHLDLGGAHPSTLSPLPALASAAALTSTLSIGTSVLNQDLRHPAVLAREAATVQTLSDGRLELGIGAGWAEYEYDWAGIPFDGAAVRLARLDEYVQIVRALQSRGPVSFEGRFFTITQMPGAVDETVPPARLMMGGYGDATLRLAARRADIVNINAVGRPDAGPGTMDRKVELIRAAAGARQPELSTMIVLAIVSTAGRRQALEQRAEQVRARGHHLPDGGLGIDGLLKSPAVLVGSRDEICAELLDRRARWGISSYLISYPDLEDFAPVVAALAGA